MTGSFLDTTVVVALSDNDSAAAASAEAFVDGHQPCEVAFYALRELLAGRVRYLSDAHNRIVAATNPGEALVGVLKIPPVAGRSRNVVVMDIAQSLDKAFGIATSSADVKREALQWLAMRVQLLWRKARNLHAVNKVQPLACFSADPITYDSGGELRGPGGSFNCTPGERCAAAGYLHDDIGSLSKLIDALHPKNLDEQAQSKNENTQRRRALKELIRLGPKKFPRTRCRALGDAYFAIMCSAQYVIATTNATDFVPLCKALGKKAVKP